MQRQKYKTKPHFRKMSSTLLEQTRGMVDSRRGSLENKKNNPINCQEGKSPVVEVESGGLGKVLYREG